MLPYLLLPNYLNINYEEKFTSHLKLSAQGTVHNERLWGCYLYQKYNSCGEASKDIDITVLAEKLENEKDYKEGKTK